MLGKRTQLDILSQHEKRVRINETIANTGDLEVNGLEVVQNMTTASRMRLDEFYNPTMLKTNLDTSSGVRPARKLAMSLTKTSNKAFEPKTYN